MLTGPPDDFERVTAALRDLQGDRRLFTVRCYDSFQDANSPFRHAPSAPTDFVRRRVPRLPDLGYSIASVRSADVEGYLSFLSNRIQQYAPQLYSVQITEEPNFVDGPDVIDGPLSGSRAGPRFKGVVEAKRLLRSLGRPQVKVGFNSTPTFGSDVDSGSAFGRRNRIPRQPRLRGTGLLSRRVQAAPDGEPGDPALQYAPRPCGPIGYTKA